MGFYGGGGDSRGRWKRYGRGGASGRFGNRGRGYAHKQRREKIKQSTWGEDAEADYQGDDSERFDGVDGSTDLGLGANVHTERRDKVNIGDQKFRVQVLQSGDESRLGWLYNITTTTVVDPVSCKLAEALDLFFIGDNGVDFRATIISRPYLYLSAVGDNLVEIESALRKIFPSLLAAVGQVELQDLDALNHLASNKRTPYLKVECWTQNELNEIRRGLQPYLRRNQQHQSRIGVSDAATMDMRVGLDLLADMREHDVPVLCRAAIDLDIRAGYWYRVDPDGFGGALLDEPPKANAGAAALSERRTEFRSAELERVPEVIERAAPTVFAFDIECTKQPLKFPDADAGDMVMMISWMVDGQGFLCINRETVSADISAFSYSPKAEYSGDFEIFNESNEKALLRRFFSEFCAAAPRVVVTYNGDNFDLPFIEKRAAAHGMDMAKEIGLQASGRGADGGKTGAFGGDGGKDDDGRRKNARVQSAIEYKSRTAIHMDCLYWVNRDSYLPQGSRGLKAVTRALLGYNPLEVDPEDMVEAALQRPQLMASYSVSDAVCTYYLYVKYVQPFIFSMCNILPLPPDDVLRKGSGTLCELLLLGEAKKQSVVAPNKHAGSATKFTDEGYLLCSETYIGGHVEALQAGVFRSDIPVKFSVDVQAVEELDSSLDAILNFAAEVEGKIPARRVQNMEEVKAAIKCELMSFKERPEREELPLIYHLDVAAMYPNIILTNRLQPHAIVDSSTCAACDFNGTSDCQRDMEWTWRGEHYTASRGEVEMLKRTELDSAPDDYGNPVFLRRVKDYSRRNYRKIVDAKMQVRSATVCQRENSFYVDTVRSFRDRRYEYKQMLKRWRDRLDEAQNGGDECAAFEARTMIVLYDSMQLAHKCILNSFYGYVMRRGARWYSMEMAGVVTQTGANIILEAKKFIERVGVPLELDTDGIWCILPSSFPDHYMLRTDDGRQHKMSFICSVFNEMISRQFSNDQYQTLVLPETQEYQTRRECSIFFEVDGPYHAMILPASKDEDKSIKKRYAVFTKDGRLAELKGFELKRRGELKLVKVFQTEVFNSFLKGSNLAECYQSVAEVADRWLDVLEQQGQVYSDEELIDLLVVQSNMSRSLAEYVNEGQKSLAITTAKRLRDFLGEDIVRDKVVCKYVVSRKPEGLQVTERAVPVQIFNAEPKIRRAFLQKWTKERDEKLLELRELVDWEFYAGRLVSAIHKIICIPAVLQKVENPVKRVGLPDWLRKRASELHNSHKQRSLSGFVVEQSSEQRVDAVKSAAERLRAVARPVGDVEDITNRQHLLGKRGPAVAPRHAQVIRRKVITDVSELCPAPPIRDGYTQWLAQKKLLWKAHRLQQLQEKLLKKRSGREQDEEKSLPARLPASRYRRAEGLSEFFIASRDRRTANLWTYAWQIISIVPQDTRGSFTLWVLPLAKESDREVECELVSIPLQVPRVLYINSMRRRDGWEARLVNRVLPRNRPRTHLYRVELPEAEYAHKTSELNEIRRSTEVNGVFEGKLSPEYNAVVNMGCVCVPTSRVYKSEAELIQRGISLGHLSPAPNTRHHSYLSRPTDLFYAFLYVATAADASERSVFALLFPERRIAHVAVVAPYVSSARIDCQRLLDEVVTARGEPRVEVDATFSSVTTGEAAGRLIAQGLSAIRESSYFGHRTALCVMSSVSERRCSYLVPGMSGFPLVPLTFYSAESRFQPLQWEYSALRAAFQRFGELRETISKRLAVAKFAKIPLGNVSHTDPYFQAFDVAYGRELRQRDFLLWGSDEPLADLGGSEEDDNEQVEMSVRNPEHKQPGMYRTVCIETEIMDLAVGSVLASEQMNDLEGTGLAFQLSAKDNNKQQADDALVGGMPLDDLAGSAGAFKVLRDLVARWKRCAEIEEDTDEKRTATMLLEHFYRWLRSENAVLHDNALHGFVHDIIRKNFRKLLSEFQRLGAQIVFASVSKIIVATPRLRAFEGLRYAAFLESTIRENLLFRGIRFAPLLAVHRSLLFYDNFNYLSVPAIEEIAILTGEVHVARSVTESVTSDELPPSRAAWDIARFLPSAVTALWTQVVDAFVRRPLLALLSDGVADKQARQNNAGLLTTETRRFLKMITQDIFEKVEEIREKAPTLSVRDAEDAQRPLHCPELEFVVMLTHILGLDTHVQDEVADLKRGLLQLLNVREFAREATFVNPSHSFILSDMICNFCKTVVDLDVSKTTDAGSGFWSCSYCGHNFSCDNIELALVREAQCALTLYQLQDLRCRRCKLIKQDNLRKYCQCSGEYELETSQQQLHKTLKSLLAVATRCNLHLLRDILRWID